jgi:hypothetical protein
MCPRDDPAYNEPQYQNVSISPARVRSRVSKIIENSPLVVARVKVSGKNRHNYLVVALEKSPEASKQ